MRCRPSQGTVPSRPMSVPPAPPGSSAAPAPEHLLALATDVATRAARLLVEGLGRERTSVRTKSSRTDMVTEMDRASEQLIVRELLTARPEDGIVGEEGSARTGTSGLRWVVDPIDGTTNYLYGFPGWSVSIAAEDDEGVVAGGGGDPPPPAGCRAVPRGGGGAPPPQRRAHPVLDPDGPGRDPRGDRVQLSGRPAPPAGRDPRRPAAPGTRHPSHGVRVARSLLGPLWPRRPLLQTRCF